MQVFLKRPAFSQFNQIPTYRERDDAISRNGTGNLNIYQNIGQVRMASFEAVVEVTPLQGLSLRGDYTYVNAADQSEGRVTDDVTNVPAHKAGFLAQDTIPGPKTVLDLDAMYVGSVYSSLPSPAYPKDPVKEVDGYFLAGAKVTQEVVKGVRVYVAIRNLLDADYESEAGYPGPGRTFAVGAAATF